MRFAGSRRPELVRDEPRVAVAARLQGPTGEVVVVNTHLSFVSWWGRRQLRRVVAAQEGCERVLVVGDLNMGPAVARRITGMRPLVSGATFPASAPVEQLDHVLARGDVGRVHTCRIHALPLSDHRAMSVDLL